MDGQVRQLKRQAEAAIDYLLAVLDSIDGDTDFEDGGDGEPSLGAIERHPQATPGESWYDAPYRDRDGSQAAWSKGARDDREAEHDGAEPDVDDEPSGDEDEPSLGAFDRLANQEHGWRQTQGRDWVHHCNLDLETQPHV